MAGGIDEYDNDGGFCEGRSADDDLRQTHSTVSPQIPTRTNEPSNKQEDICCLPMHRTVPSLQSWSAQDHDYKMRLRKAGDAGSWQNPQCLESAAELLRMLESRCRCGCTHG